MDEDSNNKKISAVNLAEHVVVKDKHYFVHANMGPSGVAFTHRHFIKTTSTINYI